MTPTCHFNAPIFFMTSKCPLTPIATSHQLKQQNHKFIVQLQFDCNRFQEYIFIDRHRKFIPLFITYQRLVWTIYFEYLSSKFIVIFFRFVTHFTGLDFGKFIERDDMLRHYLFNLYALRLKLNQCIKSLKTT